MLRILGAHTGEQRCAMLQFGTQLRTFRSDVIRPISGQKRQYTPAS